MPTTISNVNTFTNPVIAVADGDSVNALNTNVPVRALTNRTYNNKLRLDGVDTDIDTLTDASTLAFSRIDTIDADHDRFNRMAIGDGLIPYAAGKSLTLTRVAPSYNGGIIITTTADGSYVALPSGSGTEGLWLINFDVWVRLDTVNPDTLGISMRIETSDSSSFSSPTRIARYDGHRNGAGSSDPDLLKFRVQGTAVIHTAVDGRYFRLMRSAYTPAPDGSPTAAYVPAESADYASSWLTVACLGRRTA